jgi:hypothetical protein
MTFFIVLFSLLSACSSLNAALSSSMAKTFGSVIGSGSVLHLFAAPGQTGMEDNAYSYASEQEESGVTVYRISPGIKQSARLNPLATGGSDTKVIHPLYDKSVSQTAMTDRAPAVVIKEDVGFGTNQTVALLSSSELVYTNTVKIKDASGTADTSGIVGLSASANQIFAAVAPSGDSFGAANSGIAFLSLERDQGGLVVSNAQSGVVAANRAFHIDGSAPAALVAISAFSVISPIIDMYWDKKINRLFIALRVTKFDNTDFGGIPLGGVVCVLVGRVDSSSKAAPNKLVIEPIVPTSPSSFTLNNVTYGVGFYLSAATNRYASVHKVRTLHTSTGRSYVICNGGVSSADPSNVKNKVFALPIVRLKDGANPNNSAIGKLAKKTSVDSAATAPDDLTGVNDAAALVGGGDLPSDTTQDVKDMQVVGDTVFVGLQSASSIEKSGIFASSAIFDKDGKVSRWTPWQRVMGSTDRVFGMGIDTSYSSIAYLSNNTADANIGTVKLTQWGEGSKNGLLGGTTTSADVGLLKLIETEFPLAQGGVQGFFDFDNTTSSFKSAGTINNLGVMVATGYKKVMLIESGSKNGSAAFTPNTGDFSANALRSTNGVSPLGVAGTTSISFSGGVLDTLGPIATADVSRVALNGTDTKGYLFVGGPLGVAVLSTAAGAGWTTAAGVGLQRGFVGLDTTFAFRLIPSISSVVKVVCDATNLYVLTRTQLLRLSLSSATNFDGTSTPATTVLANVGTVTGSNRGAFKDFIVSGRLGLLATNLGVFRSANGQSVVASSSVDWTEVLVSDGVGSSSVGPVLRLATTSATKGGFTQGGNVYLLQTNLNFGLSVLYRLAVEDATGGVSSTTVQFVKQSPDQGTNDINYVGFSDIRLSAISNNGFLFHNRSKHFTDIDALRIIEQIQTVNLYVDRGSSVSTLSLPSGAFQALAVCRDTSSGSIIAPGQWGIRFNE